MRHQPQMPRVDLAQRLDSRFSPAYTESMTRRHPMLAMLLAVAVTAAGSACACALPGVAAAGDGGAHHAHHGHDGEGTSMACAHVECDGHCGTDAAAEREAAPKPLSPPDDAAFASVLPDLLPAMRIPARRKPPPRIWRTADTPVRRFDVLLN